MNAVIITVGDELLIGQVVNTNAAHIADRLTGAGVGIARVVTVGDDRGEIISALAGATAEAPVVIVTGGLGPTHDDVTKHAVAGFFGVPLVRDEAQRDRIGRLLESRRMKWGPAAEEQTMVPEGSEIIPNRYGTAAGLVMKKGDATVFVLPGVPYEMEQMMDDGVLPRLAMMPLDTVVVHRTLRTTGIAESGLAARLGDIPAVTGRATLAFLPSLSGVRLRLTAREPTREDSVRVLDDAAARIMEKAGKYVYGEGERELEEVVGELLRAGNLTIAAAESCTGGMVSERFTRVPGCSRYFLGSVIAYGNDLKVRLLGVPASTIGEHGAVSAEVALAMAEGVRRVTGAAIGIATTGIAGPSGGTAEKPVGLVYTGFADGRGSAALRHHFGEGRDRIMQRATFAAMETVRRRLLGIA